MTRKIQLVAAMLAAGFAGAALAVATPEEAKQLGATHTPWGAEKAGNKEGTIPAWTPGVKPPANFDPKNPKFRPDPFGSEKPLYSIDAKNMDKYADKLTPGVKAMLKKYPTFRMDIYPSHRAVDYPKFYVDNSIKNASQCKTSPDGLQLENCWPGLPFPFPKTGAEVVWNRLLKFDAPSMVTDGIASYVTDTQGNTSVGGAYSFWAQYPIFDPKRTTALKAEEPYETIRIDYNGPARKAGEKLVVHDSIDMINTGRRAWSYLPGQRRVKLAPDIAYDTPSPTGGGAATVDDSALFYGAMDRYDWKLVGKKEMIIPYNAYKLKDQTQCPEKVRHATKNHINPDCVRWELHRVWVVEANLKPGKRHVYPRRVFHFDEDLPGVGVGDNYDATGNIYRVTMTFPTDLYEAPGHHTTDEFVTYDLATGMYTHQMALIEDKSWTVQPMKTPSYFASETLAAEGVR